MVSERFAAALRIGDQGVLPIMAILIVLGALNLAVLAAVVFMVRRMRRRLIRLSDAQRRERGRFHSLWPQLESLMGLYQLLNGKADLPSLRGVSTSPDILLHVVRHIQAHAPRRIVECGSGSSTIAMAQALRAFGIDGHIHSIENYEPSATALREELRRHDLERFVTLIVVPLVQRRYEGFEAPIGWYDLEPGAIPGDIDLLLVDGPIAIVHANARYPAGPALLPKLARGGHVFIDDAKRRGERRMVERWRKLYPSLRARELPAEKGCVALSFVDETIDRADSVSPPASPRR
jgi:predicted O-methyltransferase YrrM